MDNYRYRIGSVSPTQDHFFLPFRVRSTHILTFYYCSITPSRFALRDPTGVRAAF
ncbi:hypothetical protein M405DRAFT_830062 [Rhizopogon salebrosus TDB-379]|nr:hypothetical protein M405DRAFT_830062 [Rhizopogon salebrosus TDB-379]